MNHEKVLIVEDEENERTGLAELVTGWGYRAETAKDGTEGLEKVTSWTPSIVITDLGVYRFDENGEMRLEALHPGATLDAVHEYHVCLTTFFVIKIGWSPTTAKRSR